LFFWRIRAGREAGGSYDGGVEEGHRPSAKILMPPTPKLKSAAPPPPNNIC